MTSVAYVTVGLLQHSPAGTFRRVTTHDAHDVPTGSPPWTSIRSFQQLQRFVMEHGLDVADPTHIRLEPGAEHLAIW